ncbi:alpha/beta hydrolase fold protein [Pigmentiphaga humi]|uniref:Alpha/beta hydrolase fold protein n=1 Tax=Pigmentiphaga humi TaxID=2478468 RepID=A0A3P4B3R7_9BURK|nr:alpha/beta hydrolase [Pigmentiphaga humi]VCU70944.1 alpha/beta hydrolase fold protein [Pigmentiphaga humi]
MTACPDSAAAIPPLGWDDLGQAQRDAAYDNLAAVAGAAAIQQARHEASARFRAERPGCLDRPYGPDERNRWDLFPARDPHAPCLAFIHGGYWQRGSRNSGSVLGTGVMAHGWSYACVGYPLAPQVSVGAIVAHLRRALDWLRDTGPSLGIAGPLFLCGSSVGGHLASMLLDHVAVRAGLAISGIYDLAQIRDTYLNAKLRLSDHDIATCSPLRMPAVDKTLAIAYGTRELPALIGHGRAFHGYRADRHRPGALIPVPQANHFTILDSLESPTGILTGHVLQLAN